MMLDINALDVNVGTFHYSHTKVAFTLHHFHSKPEDLVTILASHIRANDDNTYSKQRLLNPVTYPISEDLENEALKMHM